MAVVSRTVRAAALVLWAAALVLWAFALVLWAAADASAACKPRPKDLTAHLVAMPVLQALDVHSTQRFLRHGHREGNPLMRGFVQKPVALQYSVKVGVGVAQAFTFDAIACRYPGLAVWSARFLTVMMGEVVTDNYVLSHSFLW